MKNKKVKTVSKFTLTNLEADSYHLFINVKLEGKRVRFLIDTGASKTVIDKVWLEKKFKSKLSKHNIKASGLHHTQNESHIVKVSELIVCGCTLKKLILPALDLSHVNSTYAGYKLKPIQGILGSDILREYKAILDYGTGLLTFKTD